MPILKIKDNNGNVIDVPAIRGASGKSAYEYAKDGGYIGTEEEFLQALAGIDDIEIPTKVSELTNDSEFIRLQDIPTATDKVAGLTVVYPKAQCTTYTSDVGTCTPAAVKQAVEMFGFPASGGDITGHLYLTGAKPSSSTGNTSQIIFGTKTNEHVALSSNTAMLVINPNSTSSANQILLKLGAASSFPKGIAAGGVSPISNNTSTLGTSSLKWSNVYATTFTGNLSGTATKATQDGSGNVITDTYATKAEVPTKDDIVNAVISALPKYNGGVS